MIDDGLFQRFPKPDVVLGQHVMSLPAGVIAGRPGTTTSAGDSLQIRLFGRGAHGSMPEAGIDPIVMAAATVMRLQTIVSREVGASYSDDAGAVRRGVRLILETGVLIQDEVAWLPEAKQHEVRWQLTTDAEILLQGNTAVLTKEVRTLQARILTPADAVFQVASIVAGPLDRPNPGFRQLIATVHDPSPDTRVAVCCPSSRQRQKSFHSRAGRSSWLVECFGPGREIEI